MEQVESRIIDFLSEYVEDEEKPYLCDFTNVEKRSSLVLGYNPRNNKS